MLFKFVLESNAPSNLIRTPILKAIFGWKRCALYSRKYGNLPCNVFDVISTMINCLTKIGLKGKKGATPTWLMSADINHIGVAFSPLLNFFLSLQFPRFSFYKSLSVFDWLWELQQLPTILLDQTVLGGMTKFMTSSSFYLGQMKMMSQWILIS